MSDQRTILPIFQPAAGKLFFMTWYVDEFIRRNADPIWLLQNEMWEELYELEIAEGSETPRTMEPDDTQPDEIPF